MNGIRRDRGMEKATLGGGCFWCTEAVFGRVEGVEAVVPGYAGGEVANPTYEQVCGGDTGHAEVVQLSFDPQVISYEEILEIFFATHDPTTLNRQGNDVGTQYRSVVFTHDDGQERAAREIMDRFEAEDAFEAPVVTELEPLETFWPAEDYHHDYFARNGRQPYCMFVIAPKVAKMRKAFAHRLKD
jgi:peptide-methionine (S)-S-oxide reductase